MTAGQLISRLRQMPRDMEVRFAADRGKAGRALMPVNRVENYKDTWIILKFDER